jgi:hypothetical protein
MKLLVIIFLLESSTRSNFSIYNIRIDQILKVVNEYLEA